MASLMMINVSLIIVITIFTQTSSSGIPYPYTEAHFPKQASVIYVPAQIPLEQHQDLGEHQLAFQQHEGAQLYHHGGAGFQQDHHHHHHGSAQVHQQINQHGSEHKVSVQHGHGESHQVFKQEHSHGHYEEGLHEHDHEKDKNVNYQFEYSVNDHKTGDVKRHKEERKGDVVNGEYSLLEEDGNVRTVKYYADWKTGFHAEVHNSKRSHG